MSLSNLLSLSRPSRATPLDRLSHEVGDLQHRIQQIGSSLGIEPRALRSELSSKASEFGQDAAWLAGVASRGVLRNARAVKRDPVPAIAVAGTALLLLALITKRT